MYIFYNLIIFLLAIIWKLITFAKQPYLALIFNVFSFSNIKNCDQNKEKEKTRYLTFFFSLACIQKTRDPDLNFLLTKSSFLVIVMEKTRSLGNIKIIERKTKVDHINIHHYCPFYFSCSLFCLFFVSIETKIEFVVTVTYKKQRKVIKIQEKGRRVFFVVLSVDILNF